MEKTMDPPTSFGFKADEITVSLGPPWTIAETGHTDMVRLLHPAFGEIILKSVSESRIEVKSPAPLGPHGETLDVDVAQPSIRVSLARSGQVISREIVRKFLGRHRDYMHAYNIAHERACQSVEDITTQTKKIASHLNGQCSYVITPKDGQDHGQIAFDTGSCSGKVKVSGNSIGLIIDGLDVEKVEAILRMLAGKT
jgi:hypothetical protein